jgi:phosphatidylinositol glycan class U
MLHSLWLLTGTGNANFFYAATMVHGLNSSLAIVDLVGASIRANTKAAVAKQLVAVDTGETDLARNEDVFETERWRIIQLNKVD